MADDLAPMNLPMEALKRSATVTSFDPLTLLPALAMVTERIGLIAIASTTSYEDESVDPGKARRSGRRPGRRSWPGDNS